jgi:chromosome partitioning protein
MPTIAFVSPKGGAGKTTSAFLLSTARAKLQEVTVIDADPNHPIQTWANGGNTPPGLTIISDVDEDTIIERIAGQERQGTAAGAARRHRRLWNK